MAKRVKDVGRKPTEKEDPAVVVRGAILQILESAPEDARAMTVADIQSALGITPSPWPTTVKGALARIAVGTAWHLWLTSILDKLVEEGHLVKFRDGRTIRFRTTED